MSCTVIFDMDGVLFDSENLILQNWKEIASKHGYDVEELSQVFYSCIGTNAVVTKEIVCDHYGEEFPYEEFRTQSARLFKEKVQKYGMPIKPGVKELLILLKENGAKIGLASSTRKCLVEEELTEAGIREYFQVVVGGDMVEHSKPEPDVFLKCAQELSVDPKDVYIIEDSYNGIRAAKKAGATAIMVPDLIMPDEEMKHLSDHIMTTLSEVREWMEKNVFNANCAI